MLEPVHEDEPFQLQWVMGWDWDLQHLLFFSSDLSTSTALSTFSTFSSFSFSVSVSVSASASEELIGTRDEEDMDLY